MKIRILSIACVTAAAALLAACTTVYKNSDACEQMMRSQLAQKSTDSPTDTLKITHTGAGIDGSRVVVEGSIVRIVPPAAPASGAQVASSASAASGVFANAASASGAVAASGASAAAVASAASASSGAAALALKSAKPQKVNIPAAAECTFHGQTLSAFNWLAPEKFLPPADTATE
ncbi:hypothetical protein A6V36_29530 [Paraburkholderia ginsengiterrae]|uniref:Lipoprotein n=1 Tax=Paraburkholderia ginsengiterrae TaxID=1462993 RepID=A0A1A9NC95_9BURK|nr:hypothetical protein [Paraburkholderia ginsengiterrae]OAJ58705.1 hypothetical protein A6V36_29530 [Paraburkholderia ginsengiterrae]OAJ63652.1 hypothetical protein A6V37_20185 [Paraburkholderia ginsengiterrae]